MEYYEWLGVLVLGVAVNVFVLPHLIRAGLWKLFGPPFPRNSRMRSLVLYSAIDLGAVYSPRKTAICPACGKKDVEGRAITGNDAFLVYWKCPSCSHEETESWRKKKM